MIIGSGTEVYFSEIFNKWSGGLDMMCVCPLRKCNREGLIKQTKGKVYV